MCAYNQVNGEYSCQNADLLASALKAAWDFGGFVVSDWFDATKDTVKAANAGLDMEMPLGTHFGTAEAAELRAVLAGHWRAAARP
jgi:beta-glucosidase